MKTQTITLVLKYPDEMSVPPSLWDWDKIIGSEMDTYTEVIAATKSRNLADPDKEENDVFVPLDEAL